MAADFSYALPVARRLLTDVGRRLRPGGLADGLPEAPPGKRFVLVAGAGRSGTSAVARVLHESGIRMGNDFGAASDLNPEGFYEDMALVRLHDRMLAELGMGDIWHQDRWPWRSAALAAAERHREEMEELVAAAADGWKDPRLAITLEAWLPLLPARPKVVLCLRSPRAYAESVVRGFGFVDRETAQRQWAKHYRRLLDVIRDYRLEVTCVEYDALIERPEETVASLSTFLGEPLSGEYVNASLRRFIQPVPARYARLYREVYSLGGAGEPVALAKATPRRAGSAQRAAGDTKEDIEAYGRKAQEIEARTGPAKALWTGEAGMPRTKIVEYERLGLTQSQAMEETRAACRAYIAVLKDAQETLGALEPPCGFVRFHEMTEREVNLERMMAEFTLAAATGNTPNERMLRAAQRSWRRSGRSAQYEKGRERRRREYVRAREEAGYPVDGGEIWLR